MKNIKTSILVLVFSLSLQTLTFSQEKVIDSLKQELLLHPEKDTTRVRMLNNLVYDLQEIDLKTAEMFIKESELIIDSLNFIAGKAQLLYYRGYIDMMKSDYTKAIERNTEAIKLYKILNNKRGVSYSYNTIGNAYYDQGSFPKAIESYEKCIEIDKVRGDERSVAYNMENIGSIYADQGDYDKAISNYNKSKGYKQREKDSAGLVTLYLNIGSIYAEKNDSPRAIENLHKALEIHRMMGAKMERDAIRIFTNLAGVYLDQDRYDKAIEYYMKAFTISKKVNNKHGIAISLNGMGYVNKLQSKNKEALALFKETLEIYKTINDQKGLAESLNHIGDIQFSFKNDTKALDYYKQALKINKEIDLPIGIGKSLLGIAKVYAQRKQYKEALEMALKVEEIGVTHQFIVIQREIKELLTEIYEHQGDYKKAYLNHHKFKSLNDSLFNKENIEKITQLEYEYKYKQALDSASIRELKLTKTVIATNKDLEKSQQNYLWAIIAFLLVSILLGGVIFYQKFRNEKSKTQNIVIEQKLLRSQMTPHFIFNSLSVLQGMILNKEVKKSVNYLSKFSKLLCIILENSRDKTVSLSQELSAMQNYLTLQNLENDAYESTILVEDTIDVPLFEVPPMLIQPFVENAIEHAFINQKENRRIDIRLTYLEKKLICTIIDNGVGVASRKRGKNEKKKSLSTVITSDRKSVV